MLYSSLACFTPFIFAWGLAQINMVFYKIAPFTYLLAPLTAMIVYDLKTDNTPKISLLFAAYLFNAFALLYGVFLVISEKSVSNLNS